MENNLLFYILILPTIAAILIFALPLKTNKAIRWFSFGSSLIPFLLSIILWFQFDKGSGGFQF